jgi:hypothetical protein
MLHTGDFPVKNRTNATSVPAHAHNPQGTGVSSQTATSSLISVENIATAA